MLVGRVLVNTGMISRSHCITRPVVYRCGITPRIAPIITTFLTTAGTKDHDFKAVGEFPKDFLQWFVGRFLRRTARTCGTATAWIANSHPVNVMGVGRMTGRLWLVVCPKRVVLNGWHVWRHVLHLRIL